MPVNIKKKTILWIVTVLSVLTLLLTGIAGLTEGFGSMMTTAVQSAVVSLNSNALTLGKGESYQLAAVLSKGDSVKKWVSSDTAVLTVKDGLVTARKTGTASVTVRTVSGQSAVCQVTVKKAPASCALSAKELSIGVGETYRFYCTVPDGTAACVRDYTVSNKNILSFDRGTVKGLKPGTVTVSVRLFNGVTASCKVTVGKAPSSCSLSARELTLGVGESYRFSCSLPAATAARVRDYTVSNKSILSFANGTVKALKAGTATVSVRLFNGVTDSCRVTVRKAPVSCSLNAKELLIGVGESFRFSCDIPKGTAARVRNYTVDNNRFVTSDGKGGIVGRKPGTTTVHVTLFNGVTCSCRVTVGREPSKASLSAKSLTLGIGENYQFTCNIPKGTAARVRSYSVSDPSVLSCTAHGLVQGKKTGTATVTVRLYNGTADECRIQVKNAPKSVSLNYTDLALGVGQTVRLTPALPEQTASHIRRFSVSDTSVLSCDSKGNLTARKQGSAKVTLTLFNGVSAVCRVQVTAAPPSIDVQDDLAVLDIGETFRIIPLTDDGAQCSVTYRSADKSVATVDHNGVIHAKGAGTTDITLTAYNGKKARVAVIVWGDKSGSYFPDIDAVDALLNQSVLNAPMKTNCRQLDSLVSGILSQIITGNMTTAQKVRACYDYLAQNCTYGYGYIPVELPGEYVYDSDSFIVTMAYPILKNHVGTCENFAAAFTVLMRRIGIEANVVEGLVGMRAGGKGGHYWTDVTVCGRHLVFDTQVENNNLGGGGYVYHYWYGMSPEYNYRSYEYENLLTAHGFAYK